MDTNEIIRIIFGTLFGVLLYVGFIMMFVRAAWKGDFVFRYGRIRGKLAKIIGWVGMLGMVAGTYLAVSIFVFDTTPPLAIIAGFLVGLLFLTLLLVKFGHGSF